MGTVPAVVEAEGLDHARTGRLTERFETWLLGLPRPRAEGLVAVGSGTCLVSSSSTLAEVVETGETWAVVVVDGTRLVSTDFSSTLAAGFSATSGTIEAWARRDSNAESAVACAGLGTVAAGVVFCDRENGTNGVAFSGFGAVEFALHMESDLANGEALAVFPTPYGDRKLAVGLVLGILSNLALVSASSRFFCRLFLASRFAWT